MLVDIRDVITYATFGDNRLRGFGVARGRISHFAIDLRRRPYNTLALPCKCVISTVCLLTYICHVDHEKDFDKWIGPK